MLEAEGHKADNYFTISLLGNKDRMRTEMADFEVQMKGLKVKGEIKVETIIFLNERFAL